MFTKAFWRDTTERAGQDRGPEPESARWPGTPSARDWTSYARRWSAQPSPRRPLLTSMASGPRRHQGDRVPGGGARRTTSEAECEPPRRARLTGLQLHLHHHRRRYGWSSAWSPFLPGSPTVICLPPGQPPWWSTSNSSGRSGPWCSLGMGISIHSKSQPPACRPGLILGIVRLDGLTGSALPIGEVFGACVGGHRSEWWWGRRGSHFGLMQAHHDQGTGPMR